MEVSSANSATVASNQRAMRIEQTQQVQQRQTEQQQTETQSASPTPPTPVINTQGQTTGRLLNVTA